MKVGRERHYQQYLEKFSLATQNSSKRLDARSFFRRKICYIVMTSASQFLNACSSWVSRTMQISRYPSSSAIVPRPQSMRSTTQHVVYRKFLGATQELQTSSHIPLVVCTRDTSNCLQLRSSAEAECLVCLCTVRWASESLQAFLAIVASVHGNRAWHCPVLRR